MRIDFLQFIIFLNDGTHKPGWRRFERTETFYLANKNAAALNSDGRCWDQQGVCVVGCFLKRLSREGPFLWDQSVCVFSQTEPTSVWMSCHYLPRVTSQTAFFAVEAERSKGWTFPISLWRPPTERSHVIFRKH